MRRWISAVWQAHLAVLCALSATTFALAQAQDVEQESDVQRQADEIEREAGKLLQDKGFHDYVDFLRQYVSLHPSFQGNIYLETRIAEAYEWDGPHRDPAKAAEIYTSIATRYDKSHPYMKHVRLWAADRTGNAVGEADQPPARVAEGLEKQERMYRQIIEDYPDDEVLRLQCYEALGRNAQNRGDKEKAEEYWSSVLEYDTSALRTAQAMGDAAIARHNSAVGLFWLAFGSDAGPEATLEAIEAQLKKYPAIYWLLGEMVDDVRTRLEDEAKARAANAQSLQPGYADGLTDDVLRELASANEAPHATASSESSIEGAAALTSTASAAATTESSQRSVGQNKPLTGVIVTVAAAMLVAATTFIYFRRKRRPRWASGSIPYHNPREGHEEQRHQ